MYLSKKGKSNQFPQISIVTQERIEGQRDSKTLALTESMAVAGLDLGPSSPPEITGFLLHGPV